MIAEWIFLHVILVLVVFHGLSTSEMSEKR
jgi:hypothetical protein